MNFSLSEKRYRALDWTDSLSPEMRRCVHEFGDAIVRACLNAGVSQPNHIRQLVMEIWRGARSNGEKGTGGTCGANTLDWVLMQAGSAVTAATLVRVMREHGFVFLPLAPSPQMIDASLATIADHTVRVTKREKHTLRLRAAIRAGLRQHWPSLEVRA